MPIPTFKPSRQSFFSLIATLLLPTLAVADAPLPVHPSEQQGVITAVAAVNLDVQRVNGTWVGQSQEARQGSIVKTYNPFLQAPNPQDPDDYPDTPNQSITIKLQWRGPLQAQVMKLEEIEVTPSYGENQGMLSIYDGATLVKNYTESAVTLPVDTLNGWGGEKELRVESIRTGTVRLKFSIDNANFDEVRITGIPEAPRSGRILFVNKNAINQHSGDALTYDDFGTNAATNLSDAIDRFELDGLSSDTNIIVGPGTYNVQGVILKKGCLLTGIGGNHDANVETTRYDLSAAPVLDGQNQGRILELQIIDESQEVTITGLVFTHGRADVGGAILQEDAVGGLNISLSSFVENTATSRIIADQFSQYGQEPGTPDEFDLVENAGNRVALTQNKKQEKVKFRTLMSTATHPSVVLIQDNPVVTRRGGGGAISIDGRLSERDKRNFKRIYYWKNTSGDTGGAVELRYGPILGSDQWVDANPGVLVSALSSSPNTDLPKYHLAAVFDQCKFQDNQATQGGAIGSCTKGNPPFPLPTPQMLMLGGVPITVKECNFVKNKVAGGAKNRGGAIYLAGVNASGSIIRGSVFSENSATRTAGTTNNGDGGAVAVLFMATLNIKNGTSQTVFKNNFAADGGGAIYATYFAAIRANKALIESNTTLSGGTIHVTSGSIFDSIGNVVKNNQAGEGGGFHNRNSRLDIRMDTLVENNTAEKAGGVFTICKDDSLGYSYYQSGETFNSKIPLGITFPESSVCPAITQIIDSRITNNYSKVIGGVCVTRELKTDYRPANPVYKALKINIINSKVLYNTAVIRHPKWLLTGGVGLRGTDESTINRPNFNRSNFINNLGNALRRMFGGVLRWTDDDYHVFKSEEAATYIANNMLYTLTDAQIANDVFQGSTFSNNTGFEGKNIGNVTLRHATISGNIITGTQSPPGLFGGVD